MSEQTERRAPTREEEAEANLICLAFSLRKAEKAEETARTNRIKLEEMISSFLPTKEVGQETKVLSNGVSITIKRGLRYKADLDDIQEVIANQVPAGQTGIEYPDLMAPIKVKTTRELDVKGYEWYRQNHPTIFNRMSQHVTVTPAKVSVTVKAPEGAASEVEEA